MRSWKKTRYLLGLGALIPINTMAKETVSQELFTTNNLWMMICACLVFVMHLGFGSLEAGLTRAKNSVNILYKNVFVLCFGLISYALVGFNLMYPGDFNLIDGWFGFSGFGLSAGAEGSTSAYNTGYTYWTDFIFQGMFAATAATIVSGAVAERVKLNAFMIFTVVYITLVYPLVGSWKWGGGWLDQLGFYDFAGSTLVHGVGGWAALACVMIIGPRLGKYVNGVIRPIAGHSLPLATIGVFLLWFGWFGFNGGSVLSADPGLTSLTLVTTCLAAAAGGLGAMMVSWGTYKTPDLSMALNGILAGLVGITAGADLMSMESSIIIGFIAGILVVLSVLFFEKIKMDDPVGAISVHLVCGIWGTLAVGIFGEKAGLTQLGIQAIGVLTYGVVCFTAAFILFKVIDLLIGVRVPKQDELDGLDKSEHGMDAYSGFITSDLN